ncbi:MAG: flagellar biosynthetic protein FliR [Deltaproteobacteria bacterium]|nr:flagellar biosynthetic protein FliR [Deltaproteobacteria bacterium]
MGVFHEIVSILGDGRLGPALLGTGLTAARLFALFRTLPFLGGRRVPATLHLGLAAALGLAMGGGSALETVPPAPLAAALAVKEVVVGFSIGFLASLPFRFLEQSGILIDVTRSTQLSGSAGIGGNQSTPTGTFFLLMAMAVFFLTPAHRAFWMGVEASFLSVPLVPDGALPYEPLAMTAIAASAGLFASSVMIAFPVLLSVLVTDLAIGAAGRFVPHSGGTFAFMPLRSVVGLGALALALTVLAPTIARILLESMRWLHL